PWSWSLTTRELPPTPGTSTTWRTAISRSPPPPRRGTGRRTAWTRARPEGGRPAPQGGACCPPSSCGEEPGPPGTPLPFQGQAFACRGRLPPKKGERPLRGKPEKVARFSSDRDILAERRRVLQRIRRRRRNHVTRRHDEAKLFREAHLATAVRQDGEQAQ